jgi:hypothetical protein
MVLEGLAPGVQKEQTNTKAAALTTTRRALSISFATNQI